MAPATQTTTRTTTKTHKNTSATNTVFLQSAQKRHHISRNLPVVTGVSYFLMDLL